MYTYKYAYIYAHIYTHIHTYAHIHIYIVDNDLPNKHSISANNDRLIGDS